MSRHICFLFTTKTLNDLLNFSINLLDDNNKQITFAEKKKKKRKDNKQITFAENIKKNYEYLKF